MTAHVERQQSRLDAMSPAKRALFEKRLAGRARPVADAILPVERTSALPLSSAQRRLWFMDQLSPGSAVYNLPAALRLTGPLRLDVLNGAVRALFLRHEALRTVFVAPTGTPVQRILPDVEVDLVAAPLEGLHVETTRAFDLEHGPLARAALFSDGPDHVLALTIHHSVCDGWSLSILIDELVELYRAGIEGRSPKLNALPLQYADYAAWESGVDQADGLAYWRRTLDGALPVLELPLDRPRPAAQSFCGAMHRFALPLGVWSAVRELARQERTTPFVVLLAGFAALMERYAAQGEVSVATPVANRTRAEWEAVVGFFANSIALRVDTSGAPAFRELIARARVVAQDGLAHAAVPFDRVVETVDPVRSLRHAPIAQVSFALVEDPAWRADLGPVLATTLDHHTGTAKYDLTLEVWPDADEELRGQIEYATDLFDEATAARMAEHLGALLTGLLAAPDARIGTVQLFADIDVAWNSTDVALEDVHAHELFARQVRRNPSGVALVSGDRVVTFAELDDLAERLARRLHHAGVGLETRVGLYLPRCVDLVVAALATLKAGGTYVPLDLGDPADRIGFMLADADARVVVTSRELEGKLPATGAQVILVEESGVQPPVTFLRPHGDNACYVIYTSGSTGRPKGVAVTHRGLTNYLTWCLDAYRVADGGGAPLVSPLRFDLSVTTLFCPLLAGRPVTLVPEGGELDVLMAGVEGFGLVKLTPAHLEALDRGRRTVSEAEGYLVVGGEALRGSTVAAWRERAPGLRVVNEYGPTETVVGCCVHEVGDHADLSGTVPIGRPIANTRLYVLDQYLMPVVRGAIGELYVGGAGVARGYWNRPDLTASRFVPDPFGKPGGRLYRTGDLVRMNADGELECLGRTDTQVKVRGYRVELEEIEAALTRLAEVREAVVLVRDNRLVAYVTGSSDDQPASVADQDTQLRSAARLRAALSETLPEYMVPDAFVVLDELPLTSNGKVDRRALPAPEDADTGSSAPLSPLEHIVAGVWAEVLGLPSVGRDANFLRLGGHSLLATQAVARLRDVLALDLPLRVFFEATSVADLASRIEALRGKAPRPAIMPAARNRPIPLSYAQGRLYFLSRLAEDSTFYNVPVALRIDGPLDREAFRKAFGALWERHEGLRTCFPVRDGAPVQEILSAQDVPFNEIDADNLDEVVAREARTPFDLACGPLARGTLIRLNDTAHAVLLTLHHTVSDGWSMSTVLDDLFALYRAFAAKSPNPLTPLKLSYVDYAMWQRGWLEGEELDAQLGYWRERLQGVPALELPADRPRPAMQTFRGARVNLAWTKELTDAIAKLARAEGVSPFMVLMAGFDVLLARSSGQRDITVGTPIANRTSTELEGLVGFFANTLALRVDLSGDPCFTEVLRRVREAALGAYEHQDAPFEMVVDAVAPVRSLSHSPLFQVLFALQNQPGGVPACDGLTITELDGEQNTARFDLTMQMWETGTGLEGYLEYSTDLFDASTIEAMAARLEALFVSLVDDPTQRVFAMDVTTPEERAGTDALCHGAPLAGSNLFIERFAKQATRKPNAPAVTCGDVTLTYGELRQRASTLANGLDAGPEDLVAIYLDRGVDLVVVVLAVLQTGAAYVPLDPAYPAERNAAIVKDAQPAFVITSRELADDAPQCPQILFDEVQTSAVQRRNARPEHPAYVIYTSGSQGMPKGVVVTQGGLAAYIESLPTALNLQDPIFLHTASFAFSSSVRQLTVPLATGGSVVIASHEQMSDPDALLAYAAKNGVTVLDLVPSYLRVLAPALQRSAWKPQTVLTASEPLLYDLPEAIRAEPDAPALTNMYGQTETTGIIATAPVATEREGRGAVVPLGRPIPGLRMFVLGEDLRPAPVGHPGEIVVGGPGLARGYLGDPALTAQRFVADPFGPPGSRLYRTGDRGRYLRNGKVEFLGRIGDQVKIRGHRVEPQEVTAVLSRLDGVSACAVLCLEDGADERRLVGYVVATVPTADLRATLRDRLPDYLVPTLVAVEKLPRLPNGKLDRAALTLIEAREETTVREALSGPMQEKLAEIWRNVLRVQEVGGQDDFFALGGDSLHTIRVVDQARKAGIAISPAQFIANPTIAGLASVATEHVEQEHVPDNGPIPLVPSHHAFLERDFADKHLYTHVFEFETSQELDASLLDRALAVVLAHHDALRFSFPHDDGRYRLQLNEVARTPLSIVDLSLLGRERQGVEIGNLENELHDRLDYTHGPLLHFALVRLGERPDRLIAIVHHQLMDNSSWDILTTDLQTAYTALAQGQEPRLDVPRATFAQWARSLEKLTKSDELNTDLDYWRALAAQPIPRLPLDHEHGTNCLSSREDVVVEIDAATTATVRRSLPREHGLSLNDTLLAALLLGFSEWSGQDSVLVDLVARGRELAGDLDLSGAIGRFSVTSPRLLKMPGETKPATLILKSVGEQLRAVPRGGLGYGLLRYLRGEPSLAPLGTSDILLSNWGEYAPPPDDSPLLGPPLDEQAPPPPIAQMYRLIVNTRVEDGALSLIFRFSRNLHDRANIERLAALVAGALRSFARMNGSES